MDPMPAQLQLVQGEGEEFSHLLDNMDFNLVARWTERGPRFERRINRFRLRDGSRLSPGESQLLRDMLISHYRPSSRRLAEKWRREIETEWAKWPYFTFGQIVQFQPDRERCEILANGDWLESYWQDWREPHAPVPTLPWSRQGDGTPAFPPRPIT
jgi:hypothetical protein